MAAIWDRIQAAMAGAPDVPDVLAAPPLPDTVPIIPGHPYYPMDASIVGYQPNDRSTLELLTLFSSGCVGLLTITYLVVKRVRPRASVSDILATMWFTLSGFLHLFFEGYFVYNHQRIGGLQDLFGQLWKEYALSDSRYLSQDPFVLCIEMVTVTLFGPLALITASFIATNHPLRHALQTIVSFGHLYSDILYYTTALYAHHFLDLPYSRPEAQYFWGYFIGLNGFWIVVPLVLLYDSVTASGRAFAGLDKIERTLANMGFVANGVPKKAQ